MKAREFAMPARDHRNGGFTVGEVKEETQTIKIDLRTFQRFSRNLTSAAKRSGLKGHEFYHYLKLYVESVEKAIEKGEF